jgi:hypothetical protein
MSRHVCSKGRLLGGVWSRVHSSKIGMFIRDAPSLPVPLPAQSGNTPSVSQNPAPGCYPAVQDQYVTHITLRGPFAPAKVLGSATVCPTSGRHSPPPPKKRPLRWLLSAIAERTKSPLSGLTRLSVLPRPKARPNASGAAPCHLECGRSTRLKGQSPRKEPEWKT